MAVGSLSTSAAAQPEGLEQPAGPSVGLVVTSLQAVLGQGTVTGDAIAPTDLQFRALVENRGEVPLNKLEVVTVVHEPVTTRSDLRHALDRSQPDGFVTSTDTSVRDGGALEPGEVAGVEVTIPASEAGWSDDNAIYPVRIAVRRGIDVLDEVTTAVIHLATPPLEDLAVGSPDERGTVAGAFVWPLAAPPWRGPDGIYPIDVDEAITVGGRLDRLLRALETQPGAPVLLAVPAHLVEDLRDRADGFVEAGPDGTRTVGSTEPAAVRAANFLQRLQSVVHQVPFPPVTGAYADADVATLLQGPQPLPSLAADAATSGRARLRSLLGRDPDAATFLAGASFDAAAADLVPAEHLLLAWDGVEGPELDAHPDLPYPLRALNTANGRRVSASVADPYVSALVAAPATTHGHPIAIQRVMSETAMIHLARPSRIHPLLIMPPADWHPDPQVPGQLLAALRSASWVHLTTPTELLTRSTERAAAVLIPVPTRLDPAIAAALGRAKRELDALVASLPPEIVTVGGREPTALGDQLTRAASLWFTGPGISSAEALVEDVQSTIDEGFGTVTVPASAQVTLTSERGALPVTLQRNEGGPMTVRVTVSSRGNLRWPQRTQEVALTGTGTQTVSFDTLALGRGTFAVTVTVSDVTGTRVLDRSTLSVRSTAISRPALIAVGALVLLLLTWGAIRRRRPKRPALELVPTAPSEDHDGVRSR